MLTLSTTRFNYVVTFKKLFKKKKQLLTSEEHLKKYENLHDNNNDGFTFHQSMGTRWI